MHEYPDEPDDAFDGIRHDQYEYGERETYRRGDQRGYDLEEPGAAGYGSGRWKRGV